MTTTRALAIAVCGPNDASPEEMAVGEEVGQLIAERGYALVCGGLGGVMAAASRGAKSAGGVTIGILPGYDPAAANQWVDHVICTGMGQARNAIIAASGHAMIAIGGGFGTLSEIALAQRLRRPVVLLGGWSMLLSRDEVKSVASRNSDFLHVAATPDEAVNLAVALLDGESQA